jgi:hypothetical protein
MEIPLSQRAIDLVNSGVITISVHISKDGNDVWGRCTQPHPRLGVKTTDSMKIEELVAALEKVQTTRSYEKPAGASVPIPFRGKEDLYPKKTFFSTIEEAIGFAKTQKLRQVERNGVKNLLSVNSLHVDDLVRTQTAIFARCCEVSANIGTAKLTSRIATNRVLLTVTGATDLTEWWEYSTSFQKFILLSERKRSGAGGPDNGWSIPQDLLAKLDHLPVPFREAGSQVVQHEEEDPAEDSQYGNSSVVSPKERAFFH